MANSILFQKSQRYQFLILFGLYLVAECSSAIKNEESMDRTQSSIRVRQTPQEIVTIVVDFVKVWIMWGWRFSLRFCGWLFDPYLNVIEKYQYAAAFYDDNDTSINWAFSFAFSILGILSSIQTIIMYLTFGTVYIDAGKTILPKKPIEEIDPNTGLPIVPIQETDPSFTTKIPEEIDPRLTFRNELNQLVVHFLAFLYSIVAVPFTLGQCYFNYLTIRLITTETEQDIIDTWGYGNKFYDQLILIGQGGLGMAMIFLPYLSDVIVQKIFYFKYAPALIW